MNKLYKNRYFILFMLYSIFLIIILVTRGFFLHFFNNSISIHQIIPRRINLIPFLAFQEDFKKYSFGFLLSPEIFLNISIFIPFGFLTKIIFKKTFRVLLIIFLFPLLIEIFQHILATGVLDINDFIMNFIGGLLGFLFVQIIQSIHNKKKRAY